MDGNLLNISLLESLIQFNGSTAERITQTSIVFNQICRTCLCGTTDNNLDNNLILTNENDGQSVTIKQMLELSTGLILDAKDKLPNQICDRCLKAIESAHRFRAHSKRVDEILRRFLDQINNTEVESCAENEQLQQADVAVPIKSEKIDEPDNSILIENFQVSFVDENSISSGTKSNMNMTSASGVNCDATGNKKKLFKCEICEKEYSFRNGLHNHMIISHIQKKEYTCTVCNRRYKQRSKFLSHIKRFCIDPSSIAYVGNPAPRVTMYPNPKDENELLVEICNLSCALCGGTFEREADFYDHMTDKHLGLRKCHYCGKRVKRPIELETHIRSHSGERQFVCTICKKAFISPRTLRGHLNMHSKKEVRNCKACHKAFTSPKDFLRHFKTCGSDNLDALQPETPISCQNQLPPEPDDDDSKIAVQTEGLDNTPVSREYKLESEEVWVVKPEISAKTDIDLEHCPSGSKEIPSTFDQIEAKDPSDGFIITVKQEKPDNDSTNESTNVYEPPVTTIKQETSERDATLAITNEPLSDDEPVFDLLEDPTQQSYPQEFGRFTCSVASCKVEFKYYRDILNHYVSQHCVDSAPFNCPICGESFPVKKDIRKHMRLHLSCEYKCPYCPKAYWQMRDLRIHLRTHTGERPFKCPKCPKRFKQRPALKVHINTHNNCKEYKCKICSKEFFSYNGLFLHAKGHMEIKELQCTNCGKQFPTPSRLQRHKNGVCGIRGLWRAAKVQKSKAGD